MEVTTTARRSSHKLKLIVTQVLWTIKDLGLEKSKMTLEIIPKPGLRKALGSNGLAGRQNDTIGFVIDTQLPTAQMFSTVAHEMIHVRQLASGRLRQTRKGNKEQIFWCGKDMSHLPYYERPWEIEAFGKQEILARRFNDALDIYIEEEIKKNGKRKRKI